ncbi:hypothetical protein [Actinoplanes aureus]|uniref:Uncharacterized protein n=1 Tax=Actinoplanes aureus TaxID=2792083 RepID=A0A931FZD8_9ACTN|nr:hypothetical protein [Actinoplanes aureus]MBG0565588.1 hypothetical protein [Actinoplanes aureus]
MGMLDTPGGVRDLDPQRLAGWSALVSAWMDAMVARTAGQVGGAEHVRFFNPLRTATPGPLAERRISWDAFPRPVAVRYPGDPAGARRAADEFRSLGDYYGVTFYAVRDGQAEEITLRYRPQDEYCEWYAERDPDTGRMLRIVFTSEGHEYWRFLAGGTAAFPSATVPADQRVDGDRAQLLRLYRELVSPRVREEDLYFDTDIAFRRTPDGQLEPYRSRGAYNPYNVWNTERGLAHLTHPENSLYGEISLAAAASVPRAGADGTPVTDAGRLVCCAALGDPNRSSDPTISTDVNDLVRQGLSVTLRDPIGLYITAFDDAAVSGPGGENVASWWRPVRGAGGLTLRAEFAPPPDAPFGLEDVLVNGLPLEYGGQLAEVTTMSLFGAAADLGQPAPAPIPCDHRCCARDDNPDELTLVTIGSQCPPGWHAAFEETPLRQAAAGRLADSTRQAAGSVRLPDLLA